VVGGYARGSKGGPIRKADGTHDLTQVERGDHYDMTPRRLAFEWAHKLGGYGALVLSVVVTALGLAITDAAPWMWLVIGVWWALLLLVCVALQRAGRCIDTYQAIWGPDAHHPGNSRPVVGWGIRRHSAVDRPPETMR
jgi:hypothetical protein